MRLQRMPHVSFSVSGPTGRTRSSETAQRRVLDAATRQRRQKKQLEMLEKDNSHDDPHNSLAQLSSKAKLPTFAETSDGNNNFAKISLCRRLIHDYVLITVQVGSERKQDQMQTISSR